MPIYLQTKLSKSEDICTPMNERSRGPPFEAEYRLEMNARVLMDGPQSPSMFTHQMREFIDAIHDKRVPLPSGREVLPFIRTLDGARMAVRTGFLVSLV